MRNKAIWLLSIISLAIIGLITASIINPHNKKPEPAPGNPAALTESGENAGHKIAHSNTPEAANKETGMSEQLPAGTKTLEPEHKPEQLINAWRDAVIAKDPKKIEQLGLAVKGLGETSVPLLRKLAQEDANERVRAFAVRTLGRMRNTDFAPMFRDMLEKDSSPFVRENAAWALGELKDSQSIAKLQAIADNDASEQVRSAAKKAIETINNTTKKE